MSSCCTVADEVKSGDQVDVALAGNPNSGKTTIFNGLTGLRQNPAAGYTVSAGGHLNGELGLVIAPNGDILTVNGGNGNLVEITPSGTQIAVSRLDSSGSPKGAGALFGLAVVPGHDAVYFVDDATNQLDLLHA